MKCDKCHKEYTQEELLPIERAKGFYCLKCIKKGLRKD